MEFLVKSLKYVGLIGALLVLAFVLSGCGSLNRQQAQLVGYSKICVENVTYLQFPSGVVEQRTIDDRLVLC